MEKKKFEKMLEAMGVEYTYTGNRATEQSRQSFGRYNITGDWIEEEVVLNVEPDSVLITQMPDNTGICEHCNLVVDNLPVIHIQCKLNRFKTTDWKIKCTTCRKEIDFRDFKQSIKPVDK